MLYMGFLPSMTATKICELREEAKVWQLHVLQSDFDGCWELVLLWRCTVWHPQRSHSFLVLINLTSSLAWRIRIVEAHMDTLFVVPVEN